MTPLRRGIALLLPASLFLPLTLVAQRPPTNVAAAYDARGSVTITWTGSRGVASYRVLRAADPKSTGSDLTRPLDPSTTSFVDQKVDPSVAWYYQVIAVYGDGSEGPSMAVLLAPPAQAQPVAPVVTSMRTPVGRLPAQTLPAPLPPAPLPPAPPPPAAPQQYAVVVPNNGGATLSKVATKAAPPPTGITIMGTPAEAMVKWTVTPGASSYRITRQQQGAANVQQSLSSPGWTDKGLRPGTTYTYYVDAMYPDGSVGTAQMPFTTPPAINPSYVTASSAGPGKVKLTWPFVSGADYYIVLGPGSANGGAKINASNTYTVTNAPAGTQTWMVGSYYDPGPGLQSCCTGPNAVSTSATLFTKATFNVPATPVNTAHMTNLNPGVQGFAFVNTFKNSFIGPPVSMTTGGLCGGMSYAVLDYYNAGMPVPKQWYRPANNTTIQHYLYGRQVTSLVDNLDKWAETSINPGGSRNIEFFNWGISGRLTELKASIDAGHPIPLGLKGGGGPLDSRDHQVLAIGYDLGRYALDLGNYKTDVKIFILDPNYPGIVMTLVPDPSTAEYYEIGHTDHRWRTYFVDGKYRPVTPPAAVNTVYPADNLVHELLLEFDTGADDMRGGGDWVNLKVNLTNGTSQSYTNISQGGIFLPNYLETVQVVLSQPVTRSQIKSVEVVTNAGGGISGDNWDMTSVLVIVVGGGFASHSISQRVGPYRFTGARTPYVVNTP